MDETMGGGDGTGARAGLGRVPGECDAAVALGWSQVRVEEAGGVSPVMALWLPRGISAVVGISQDPVVELYADLVRRDGVEVVRRRSGGGAVLLHPGVLCWEAMASLSFVDEAGQTGSPIHRAYAALCRPVLEGLQSLGLDAFQAGISDISIRSADGEIRKLAGTAQMRRRDTVLVHGSLLVQPDLELVERYLRPPSQEPEYRRGRSHRDFCLGIAEALGVQGGDLMLRVADALRSAALDMGWRVTEPAVAGDAAIAAACETYRSPLWNWEKGALWDDLILGDDMGKMDKALVGLRVDGKNKIALAKLSTDSTEGVKDKKEARAALKTLGTELDALQYRLYAQSETALLVVLQAIDTGGKDGVIRKVFGPVNPQGVEVSSFKRPTPLELSHDFLWRIHKRTPAKGMIGIFNRSHYEDVLVHKVYKLISDKQLDERYDQINEFEKLLARNNTVVVKFFLHISKDEQKRRLQSRLDNPEKRWKFEESDLKEREKWDKYQAAYQAMLDKCSFAHAPWFVIPADNKWYRDWAVMSIVVQTLRDINPRIPKAQPGVEGITVV